MTFLRIVISLLLVEHDLLRKPVSTFRDHAVGADPAALDSLRGSRPVLRIWRATMNSWRGLVAAARSERAFREELIALAIALPLAFVVATEAWKRFMLIGVVLLLMAVELLNTAIEKLSDHVTPAQHPDIGRVKDMGSAAVGVALAIAGFTWLLALAERIGLI
jgi:diacylglycerol kinase (ATP)